MWLRQRCAIGPETSPVQSGFVRAPITSRSASAASATSTSAVSPSANCSCHSGSGDASSKTPRIPRRYGALIFSSGSRPSSATSRSEGLDTDRPVDHMHRAYGRSG